MMWLRFYGIIDTICWFYFNKAGDIRALPVIFFYARCPKRREKISFRGIRSYSADG